ncbi:MAG: hypothetical protein JW927_20010 [Deltaproteobacteria bacterium]|nr:hypothetical protein [Deltaproteobacteria bacterium]
MKRAIKAFSFFVLFIVIFLSISCATTLPPVPEKYNFDNKLEKVDRIVTFREPTWEELDAQSIILRVALNDYYLLILERPISTNHFDIGIPGTGSTISAGYDRVVVIENTVPLYYKIDRIYRLKDKKQKEEIRALLKIKN